MTRATTTTSKPDLAIQAANALRSLQELTASLPIDDAITPEELAATRVTRRVPREAMSIVAGVLAANPKQFPQFDVAGAQGALDYAREMAPVAQAALVLSKRITKSVLKYQAAMAQQTLAVYQVMKGTSRLSANEEARTQMQEMKELFTTKRRSRATEVSQKEADALIKTRKSAKKKAVALASAAAAATQAAIATAHATLDAALEAGSVPAIAGATGGPGVAAVATPGH